MLATLPAGSAERRLLILNRGTEAIYTVEQSHASADDWGDDLLGADEVIGIGEGTRLAITYDDTLCFYDFRAIYHDGHVDERQNVDVCGASNVTFSH